MTWALRIAVVLLAVLGVVWFFGHDDASSPEWKGRHESVSDGGHQPILVSPEKHREVNGGESLAPTDEAPAEPGLEIEERAEPAGDGTIVARSMIDGQPRAEFTIGIDAYEDNHKWGDTGEVILFKEERPGWLLIGGALVSSEKKVWAVPTGTLMLEVETFDGPLDPEAVRIKLQHPDTNHATKFHFEGEPERLRTDVVPVVFDLRSRPEQIPGMFELRVPRLEGVLAHVRASGFRNAWFELPVANHPDIVLSQRVTLVRTPSVAGRFVDFQGDGTKPDQVMAYLRIPAPADRWELEKLAYGGAASGWSVVGRKPNQSIVLKQGVDVAEDGTFRYVVHQRGDVLIHATMKGQASVFRELLDVDRDDRDVGDLRFEPTRVIRTRLVGKPIGDLFTNETVTFVARNDVGLLPDIRAKADAEGIVSLTSLVAGQEYKIRCYPALQELERIGGPGEWWFTFEGDDGKRHSHFVWDGQDEIVVTAIKTGD